MRQELFAGNAATFFETVRTVFDESNDRRLVYRIRRKTEETGRLPGDDLTSF